MDFPGDGLQVLALGCAVIAPEQAQSPVQGLGEGGAGPTAHGHQAEEAGEFAVHRSLQQVEEWMPVAPLRNTSRAGVHPWTCPLLPVGLTGFVSLAEVLAVGGALWRTLAHAMNCAR